MRLMLLRHGKPESESPTGRDFDCPLAKEGFRQAQFIAAQLEEERKLAGSTPVAVLSSQRRERGRRRRSSRRPSSCLSRYRMSLGRILRERMCALLCTGSSTAPPPSSLSVTSRNLKT